MTPTRGILATLAAGAFLFTIGLRAQDEQSLGDAARQSRLQKQQKNAEAAKDVAVTPAKDAQGRAIPAKDALTKEAAARPGDAQKAKRVITNDEIPEHIGPTKTLPARQYAQDYTPPPTYSGDFPAEYWKNHILALKNALVSLQSQISELANSIQFASGSCVSNCVQWNEEQLRKQQTLESMKAQLEQQQKSLEQLQDAARKQGFGSAVYDP